MVASNILRWLNGRKVTHSLTLGSGLGGFGADNPDAIEIDYRAIGLPPCGAASHAGKLRHLPTAYDQGVLILDGRVHCYEGYDFQDVVLGVRAITMVGAKDHIVTCASGGVNVEYQPGELVLIADHLNLMGGSPLTGTNDDEIGPRFPDMTHPYDEQLRMSAHLISSGFDIKLHEGVYAAVRGPSYETAAEVRMLRTLGADMVGMSTVPEVIALRHMRGRVLGISCVANHAAGVTRHPLSHEEVVAACAAAAPSFQALLMGILNMKTL